MYIKYTNTIEDGIKYQLHYHDNSPSIKRTFFITRITLSLALLIFFAISGYKKNDMSFIVIGLILTLIIFFYFPHSTKKLTEKLTKKMYKEGQNRSFLCEHILEIGENHLIEKTDQGQRSCLFSCVERICLTDEYAFIYIGAVEAHAVPIKRVSEGDFNEFLKELKLKCTL